MHILFVSLNSQYIHVSPAPYSLAAGLSCYAKETHTCRILSSTVNEKDEDILAEIEKDSPDILGLCAYIWNIEKIFSLLPAIKRLFPKTVIVLGGPEASFCAEKLLSEHKEIDGVLSGEGEYPIALLADTLQRNGDKSAVLGYSYREGSAFHIASPYVGKETPPLPYAYGYLEAVKGKIAYFEASRGCPFSCAFCLSGRLEGVRYFDTEKILPALISLADSGCRVVKFVDRTFNAHLERAKEIWRFLMEGYGVKYPKEMRFHFEIAGELLDEEAFALLESAPYGLFQLEVGLQSFSAKTLKAIHRPPVTERLCSHIRRLREIPGIHTHIDLIAGLPYEGLEAFAQSFDKAYRLSCEMLQLGFLKLLHGAPMRKNREEFPCTYTEKAPYEVTETPWLTKEDMKTIHLAEKGTERVYNSMRFGKTLAYLSSLPFFSPFSFFVETGRALALVKEHTLDGEYTALYQKWISFSGVCEKRLRDYMTEDFLSWNSSRCLPRVLQRQDSRLKKARLYFAKHFPAQKAERRSVALLPTQNCAILCRYLEKDSVTGLYPLVYAPLLEIEQAKNETSSM
ncbi:MAG: DUF4080 domain-containing protein [Clostridia bacterium]|nr:DUF4080 domain-containing protein [Clostridia bacterium]